MTRTELRGSFRPRASDALQVEQTLRGVPHRELRAFPLRDRGVHLHRRVNLDAGAVGSLDDHLRLGEALGHVAALVLRGCRTRLPVPWTGGAPGFSASSMSTTNGCTSSSTPIVRAASDAWWASRRRRRPPPPRRSGSAGSNRRLCAPLSHSLYHGMARGVVLSGRAPRRRRASSAPWRCPRASPGVAVRQRTMAACSIAGRHTSRV